MSLHGMCVPFGALCIRLTYCEHGCYHEAQEFKRECFLSEKLFLECVADKFEPFITLTFVVLC